MLACSQAATRSISRERPAACIMPCRAAAPPCRHPPKCRGTASEPPPPSRRCGRRGGSRLDAADHRPNQHREWVGKALAVPAARRAQDTHGRLRVPFRHPSGTFGRQQATGTRAARRARRARRARGACAFQRDLGKIVARQGKRGKGHGEALCAHGRAVGSGRRRDLGTWGSGWRSFAGGTVGLLRAET